MEKRTVYHELMNNYPGITSEEVVEELRCMQSSNSTSSNGGKILWDVDMILINIIAKRQLNEEMLRATTDDGMVMLSQQQQQQLLLEQENKDYDDAVRESEKERDVIAV